MTVVVLCLTVARCQDILHIEYSDFDRSAPLDPAVVESMRVVSVHANCQRWLRVEKGFVHVQLPIFAPWIPVDSEFAVKRNRVQQYPHTV